MNTMISLNIIEIEIEIDINPISIESVASTWNKLK